MDKTYRTLFATIARAIEVNAERVMEVNKQNNDEKGYQTAETMRADYATLYDNLSTDAYQPTKADFARLLIGCSIVVTQLAAKIKKDQEVLNAYKTDTMPKLQQVVNAETDEDREKLITELFTISQEKSESND